MTITPSHRKFNYSAIEQLQNLFLCWVQITFWGDWDLCLTGPYINIIHILFSYCFWHEDVRYKTFTKTTGRCLWKKKKKTTGRFLKTKKSCHCHNYFIYNITWTFFVWVVIAPMRREKEAKITINNDNNEDDSPFRDCYPTQLILPLPGLYFLFFVLLLSHFLFIAWLIKSF